jgi:hypothetical protein
MARESRRKREEKRFGRPERLADMVLNGSCAAPSWLSASDRTIWMDCVAPAFRDSVEKSVRCDCSSVADYIHTYVAEGKESVSIDCGTAVPNWKLPFQSMFFEFRSSSYLYEHWGILVVSLPAGELVKTNLVKSVPRILDADSVLCGSLCIAVPSMDHRVGFPLGEFFVPIDEMGNLSGGLFFRAYMGHRLVQEEERQVQQSVIDHSIAAFYSIGFMNCKNVSLSVIDPDPVVNRERRRAGLKPFLRYHTINIEPMKTVLRTEGGIESNGLRKALHICRGHFATYTDRFLGRTLDKPLTVWRPSHVRGSAKQGVVFSDYNVKAPKEGDEGT